MKIQTKQWSLRKLFDLKDEINPSPQFQRGEVWKDRRKQLLIDSILRGYDFPKVYLSKNKNSVQYTYDVADGQQRLRAIWDYFSDAYGLAETARTISGHSIAGVKFSELPLPLQRRLQTFNATVAIISDMPQEELRILFARLQMGVVLTPPELRNAISSAVGAAIHTAAETHPFFKQSKIAKTRFKRQDFLSHALALAFYDNSADLKADLLAKLYEEQATAHDRSMMRKAYDVLDWMAEINREAKQAIRTKWGFVDIFWFLYQRHGCIKAVDSKGFSSAYVAFESDRVEHSKKPEHFLRTPKAYLYEYIQAFNTSGGVTDRVQTRSNVITKVFSAYAKE
jgi:hypothetical protein